MTICDTCVEHDGCEDRRRWKIEYGIEPGACSDYEERKTNAGRIRSMTDEELAHTINDYFMGCPPVDCEDGGCEQCWLDWLKKR